MGGEVDFHGASLNEMLQHKFLRICRESSGVDVRPLTSQTFFT